MTRDVARSGGRTLHVRGRTPCAPTPQRPRSVLVGAHGERVNQSTPTGVDRLGRVRRLELVLAAWRGSRSLDAFVLASSVSFAKPSGYAAGAGNRARLSSRWQLCASAKS